MKAESTNQGDGGKDAGEAEAGAANTEAAGVGVTEMVEVPEPDVDDNRFIQIRRDRSPGSKIPGRRDFPREPGSRGAG